MEELRHALHAAADDPPPTRIDLDQLIDGTRRRSRFQYRVGTLAGITALTASAIAVPFVVLPVGGLGSGGGGGAPPDPCVAASISAAPVPSESIGVVAGPTGPPSGVPSASLEPSPPPSGGPPPSSSGGPSNPPSGGPSGSPSAVVDGSPPPSVEPSFSGGPEPSDLPVPKPSPTRYMTLAPCVPPDYAVCPSLAPEPISSSVVVTGTKGAWCRFVREFNVGIIQEESARLADGWTINEFQVPETGALVLAMTGPGGVRGTMSIEPTAGNRGTPQQICAELSRTPGYQGGTCTPQREGDVLFVKRTSTDNKAVDFRADGTQVVVTGESPVPMSRLIGFARDRDLTAR
jgi:hypothetical protein